MSVLIPTRNRASLLRRCLESVRRQTWRDLEVVIADDASRDGTANVVRDCGIQRLTVVPLTSPVGAPRARAAALARCSGKFIAFLDDDDEWKPDKLRLQIERILSCRAIASHSDFDVVDAAGRALVAGCLRRRPLARRAPATLRRLVALYRDGHFRSRPTALFSSVLVARRTLDEVGGFDLRFKRLHDDTDLWMRVCRRHGPSAIDFVDDALVRYRFHPGQISVPQKNRGASVEGLRAAFDARIDNMIFLDKTDEHAYCHEGEHICRGLRRGRFSRLIARNNFEARR